MVKGEKLADIQRYEGYPFVAQLPLVELTRNHLGLNGKGGGGKTIYRPVNHDSLR